MPGGEEMGQLQHASRHSFPANSPVHEKLDQHFKLYIFSISFGTINKMVSFNVVVAMSEKSLQK